MESPPKQLVAHIVFKAAVTLFTVAMLFVPAAVFFDYWAAVCAVLAVYTIVSSLVEVHYLRQQNRIPKIVHKYEEYIKFSDKVLEEVLAQMYGEKDAFLVRKAYYTAINKTLKDKIND